MMSFLFPIVAAQLVLWSDRAGFWDPDSLAPKTEECDLSGNCEDMLMFQNFIGKRVLMLVHGFNTTAESVLKTYQLIQDNFSTLKDEAGRELYDIVIGYLWPGNDHGGEYYQAKRHAQQAAKHMTSTVQQLASTALSIDLFAHSMGNRLMLEALKPLPSNPSKKPINNFYSLAPAVDNESLEKGEEYYPSTKQCENIFVFHSERDDVLKYLYLTSEADRALGYKGEEHSKYVPMNVQFIDCTAFVGGHSEYFHTQQLYQFILNQQEMRIAPPASAMHLKLLANGLAEKS